jgi:hypothetical protein
MSFDRICLLILLIFLERKEKWGNRLDKEIYLGPLFNFRDVYVSPRVKSTHDHEFDVDRRAKGRIELVD